MPGPGGRRARGKPPEHGCRVWGDDCRRRQHTRRATKPPLQVVDPHRACDAHPSRPPCQRVLGAGEGAGRNSTPNASSRAVGCAATGTRRTCVLRLVVGGWRTRGATTGAWFSWLPTRSLAAASTLSARLPSAPAPCVAGWIGVQ